MNCYNKYDDEYQTAKVTHIRGHLGTGLILVLKKNMFFCFTAINSMVVPGSPRQKADICLVEHPHTLYFTFAPKNAQ